MDAKEYYHAFRGRRVRLINTLDVPRRTDNPNPYAIVVGYVNYRVLVMFEEDDDKQRMSRYVSVGGNIELSTPTVNAWQVNVECLELDYPTSMKPPKKSRCKLCHSLGFKTYNLFICSNKKCRKSQKVIRQKYKTPKITKPIDNYVRCPECNEIAHMAYWVISEVANTYRGQCPNNHHWFSVWNEGDMLLSGAGVKYVFDGARFVSTKEHP
jgi:hypothetical protein